MIFICIVDFNVTCSRVHIENFLQNNSNFKSVSIVSQFYITSIVRVFQGEDNVEYFLGLTPSGIVVLRNKTTVAYYYWPRIAKVYFKGRYFMLRVCDKNVRYFSN